MPKIKQMFCFEQGTLRVGKKFFRPLKDAKRRWESVFIAEYRVCGHNATIIYELKDGRFVLVECAICFQVIDQKTGLRLWDCESPARAMEIEPTDALKMLLNAQFEIPDSLEPYLDEIDLDEQDERDLDEAEDPPRPLEYWVKQDLLGRNARTQATEVDLREEVTTILSQAVKTVQALRRGSLSNEGKMFSPIELLEGDLFRRYEVDPDSWWGDPNCVPPERVGLLDLPWPVGSEAVQRALKEIRDLLQPSLSVLHAGRFLPGEDNYPSPEERDIAEQTLFGHAGELEEITIRLRDAFEEVKDSVFSTSKQSDTEIQDEPDPPKRPSENALIAFRLSTATGMKQEEIAELMREYRGSPTSQGQVSRWLKEVGVWLEECRVLPPLPEMFRGSIKAVDPQVIDQGANKSGRTRRQRKSAK